MRTWFLTSTVVMISILAVPAFAEEEHRHADAHQHGHGSVNIAVEGNRIDIELEAPGSDIVGFEHVAETQDQKKELTAAKTKLADVLSLIKIIGPANCNVDKAAITFGTQGHDEGEHGKDHEAHEDHADADHAKEAGKDGDADADHAEFHATYQINCENTGQIKGMAFDYFKAFPSAQELDVSVVTAKNQTKFEVTRDKPEIALTGSF